MAVNSTIAQARASGGDVAAAIKASRAKTTTPTIAPITGAGSTVAAKTASPTSTPTSSGSSSLGGIFSGIQNAASNVSNFLQSSGAGKVVSAVAPTLSSAIQTGASKIANLGKNTNTSATTTTPVVSSTPSTLSQTTAKPTVGINSTTTPVKTINTLSTPSRPTTLNSDQLKNFTDINTARKSDTGFGTKDILMKANDQGLKGDARRQYIADQIAKKSSTTDEEKNKGKSILQQQQELLDQKDAQSKIDKEKDIARITQDENTLLATKQKNKEVTDKYFSDIEAQENDYFNQYEAEQNKLLSEGEGTQLNQVRSQIYQALAARGVDISKMPPEQLIALSGDIGTKAFSNIYQMKENVKNRILEKSREKLNRLNDLKSKKTINENEYNEAVQSVNSAANLQRSDVDKQFAQAILGTAGAKIQLGSNVATENANLALTLGKDLGLSPSDIGILSKYIDPNKTAAENQAIILQSMQDKNSPVNKAIQANKDATNKAEMQKLLVDIEKNTQDNTVKIQIANINKDIENGKLGDAKAKTKVLQDELTAKKDAGYFKPNTTAPINWFTTGTPSGGAGTSAP